MSFTGRIGDVVADRPLALVGVVLALAGVTHFAAWTEGAGPGGQFADALGQGNLTGAMPELATYATVHPAYVAAAVVGVALVFGGD
ncbi:hypothetical protein [Halobacterium jilantaiense]|uniref:Uncharacterized protein n=1 Tax=Halobacterium jilantaiense TaxID=355548 RepID=A0A1I0N9Q7_9EURY|nr:hypothetical protein [Halobacterium jilantaiense]SEV97962.1 hypothetical protein SAMN04487945_0708 [Halobacterium jilantaiense]